MDDETRPTLTINQPRAGRNERFSRILIGMHDYYSGLEMKSFTVTADFDLGGVAAGENLSPQFEGVGDGVFEWTLKQPIATLSRGILTVSVKDHHGNVTRIKRSFWVR